MDNTVLRLISPEENFKYDYSICTLVTNMVEYGEMVNSFEAAGFLTSNCEYIYIDNIGKNSFEAYAGLNRFLREAKGRYIILCHQDILLIDNNRKDLDNRINEVSSLDANWGVLGNAGGVNLKYTVMHITQNNGHRIIEKYLPLRMQNLDENFMVVRNDANLALSANLKGFHMYGPDLCMIADILGFSVYSIDFNLMHKSNGKIDKSFFDSKDAFRKKYNNAFRSRFIGTTITRFYVSGSWCKHVLFNTSLPLFFARQYYKAFKSKSTYYKSII